jgi:hypothetical protein
VPKLSEHGRKVWANDIERAEKNIEAGTANPGMDDDIYNLSINPEDFLDLISGKWDEPSN